MLWNMLLERVMAILTFPRFLRCRSLLECLMEIGNIVENPGGDACDGIDSAL